MRLLLLAHTRGLIAPDYKFGVRSKIREEIVLDAMAKEVAGDILHNRALVETGMLQWVKPESFQSAIDTVNDCMASAKEMKLFGSKDALKAARRGNVRDTNEMAQLLKVLKATDFYDRMAEILRTTDFRRR